MNNSDLDAIRQQISHAHHHEVQTGELADMLQHELPHLHHSIRLPSDNAVAALMDFVVCYIDSVPDCLASISTIAKKSGLESYTSTFLNIARDFFLKPPEVLGDNPGMTALLGEAYLCHRLMEEINDRFIGRCGMPMAPVDLTMSNLIVHQLIGEPFANELDMAVQFALEICASNEQAFESNHFLDYIAGKKDRGDLNILDDWPCLAEEKAICLEFSSVEDYADILGGAMDSNAVH